MSSNTRPEFTYLPANRECLVCGSIKFTDTYMRVENDLRLVQIECDDCNTVSDIAHDNEGDYIPPVENEIPYMRLTSDSAEFLWEDVLLPAGSILMVNGLQGTSYQLFASDNKFHGTNGNVLTKEQILALPNVWLVFTAPASEG